MLSKKNWAKKKGKLHFTILNYHLFFTSLPKL